MASAVQPTAALPEDVPYKIEKVEVPQPDDNLVLVDSAQHGLGVVCLNSSRTSPPPPIVSKGK